MSGAELIKYQKKAVALIIRKDIKVKGIKFFTPLSYPFQIGFHHRPKNTTLKPHLHPPHNFFIKSSQEVLYILKGQIKVDFYNRSKKLIKTRILNSGDSVLFVSGGHGVKFLKNSRIFEIKQGPYPGDKKAKIFI